YINAAKSSLLYGSTTTLSCFNNSSFVSSCDDNPTCTFRLSPRYSFKYSSSVNNTNVLNPFTLFNAYSLLLSPFTTIIDVLNLLPLSFKKRKGYYPLLLSPF